MDKYLILSLLILGVGNIYPKSPVEDSARDDKRIVLSDLMRFAIDQYWNNADTYLGLTNTLGPNGFLQPHISELIYEGCLNRSSNRNFSDLHPDEYVKRLAKMKGVELMPLKPAFRRYIIKRANSPYFGTYHDTRKNLVDICGYESHFVDERGDVHSVSEAKGKTPECQKLLRRFMKNAFAFYYKEGIDFDELPLYADDDEDKK